VQLELVIVLGLAAWRLTRIIPADRVAVPLRNAIVVWAFGEHGRAWKVWLHDLVTCNLCFSLYVSGAVTGVFGLYSGWLGWAWLWQWAAVWAVATGLAIVLEKALDADPPPGELEPPPEPPAVPPEPLEHPDH